MDLVTSARPWAWTLGLELGQLPPQQMELAEDTPAAGLPKGSWEHGLPGQPEGAVLLEAILKFCN